MAEENAFEKLTKGFSSEYRITEAHKQYEHRRVLATMRALGLTPYIRELSKTVEASTGGKLLAFMDFKDRFPTFPFLLGASRLCGVPIPGGTTPESYLVHTDPFATETARFKNFERVPFVIAYRSFCEYGGAANGRSRGLVFNRRGWAEGMIIHDDSSEQYWNGGLCWVYKEKKSTKRLYIQPYAFLLAAIYNRGRGWQPE